jgi:polar amino acid transport system substrate-binding protein
MSIGTQQAIGRIVVLLSAILWPWLGEEAEADPVRIAYADVFPPFTELKGGEAQGLAVEIVRAAARRAGIEIDFVPVPFEQTQRTLDDGQADVVLPPLRSRPSVSRASISANRL